MLEIMDLSQPSKWDEIVKTFKDYDVYNLSGYVNSFRIHGDGEPILFYYTGANTRAINIVMKRDISKSEYFAQVIEEGKYFDLSSPYGYGGWIIEGNETDELFLEYEKWCLNNSIVCEFVRFNPILHNNKACDGVYDVVHLGNTVSIDTRDKDAIWNNFSGKNRNVIRKAINNGVVIKHGLSLDLFKTFIKIYNSTMDKDNAEQYYYFSEDFYASIYEGLSDNAEIFYALKDDVIISMAIIIYANGKMNYHLSGSVREYQSYAPSNLLLYKAAEWANKIGCSCLHLGGGVSSSEDSLFKFKRAFYKGELCEYYIGKKIYNNEEYQMLVDIRTNISKNNFFPKYRG